jgi:hypothetical protein
MKNEKNFRGVFAIDMLPKKIRKDESGIINFQPSNCYASHWVCYILTVWESLHQKKNKK